MNRILLIVLFLGANLNAQTIVIPDPYFKSILLIASPDIQIAKNLEGAFFKIDANNDQQIQVSEAAQVSELHIQNDEGLVSIEGIQSFTNLKFLDCHSGNLTEINLSGLAHLETLWCWQNFELASLNTEGCSSLLYFSGYGTNLSSLDFSDSPLLEELVCVDTPLLQVLDVTGYLNLKKLLCSGTSDGNGLNTLDVANLANLEEIWCGGSQITQLDLTGLIGLKHLNIGDNQLLNSIDLSPCVNLEQFECGYSIMPTVDVSMLSKLISLNMEGSNITAIDVSGLTHLVSVNLASVELLSSFNANGCSSLFVLNCINGGLENIDLTGCSSLQHINLDGNNLTSIDLSTNPVISIIRLEENPIQQINIKNGNTILTPDIYLSSAADLQYLCCDAAKIPYYETLLAEQGSPDTEINSYCSFVPGGTFYTISGQTKINVDGNGCEASQEIFGNLTFNITNGSTSGSLISGGTGNYSIPVQNGTHTITPVFENSEYFTISPSYVEVTFTNNAPPAIQNFCITPNGVHNDLEVFIVPIGVAVPGFEAIYRVLYKNKGNTSIAGGLTFSFNESTATFQSASTTPQSNTAGILSWTLPVLQPFESNYIDVQLEINTPTESIPVNGNDVLSFEAIIAPTGVDSEPNDNQFVFDQTVVNSMDPNDKTCLEGAAITPDMVGDYVHYMIRFENTGTFPAQNIVVKDIIDAVKFDLPSLQMVSSSHSCYTRIQNSNEVEFIFEDIQLPFTPDPLSHGYVLFKIKTAPNLVLGDTFSNDAEIYFDYNYPIITNNETTTISVLNTASFADSQTILYPNPAEDKVHFTGADNIVKVEILDMLGRNVKVGNDIQSNTVDISDLHSGTYVLKLFSVDNIYTSKLIKK
ncbi:MAG TPA: T9SS type A sorting domain-containing protein [Flavobacterium sp.]|jgi:hypothetical protein